MPVFGGLARETVDFVLAHSHGVTVAADDFFFEEGQEGDSFFVLKSGKVMLTKHWQDTHYHLRNLRAGDSFGLLTIVDFGPRSGTARALTDCRAIEVASRALLELYRHDLEQYTLMYMNIAREISRRLRQADRQLFHAIMNDKSFSGDVTLASI